MLKRLLQFLSRKGDGEQCLGFELPTIERLRITHLLRHEEQLPHLNWAAAWAMIEAETSGDPIAASQLSRAIVAGWLEELCDALKTPSRCWRDWAVEGVMPIEGKMGQRAEQCARRSLRIIGDALEPIRGSIRNEPIPPIAIILLATADEYYSFISAYHPDGEFATSGGVYQRESADNCATLVVDASLRQSIETILAHELTHHALVPTTDAGRLGSGLPHWAEEGLTQMMEERVTGSSAFSFGRDVRMRHIQLWQDIGLDAFVSGASFHSPEGEEQELSYNLAEAMTRMLLSTRPDHFFAFARACVRDGLDPTDAAYTHLGDDAQSIARNMLDL
jgi:hypothetical protein